MHKFDTILVSTSFARPANATAYAAKDAVADATVGMHVLTFANAARRDGNTGYITGARLTTDQSTNTARFRLHLFNASPAAIADNAAYAALWADRDKYLGSIDFAACAAEGAGSDIAQSQATPLLAFGGGVASALYGLLETLDVFTPASEQSFRIDLTVENN